MSLPNTSPPGVVGSEIAPSLDASSGDRMPAGRVDHRHGGLSAIWRSTIGKKYVVAATGVILASWLVLHMLGNLKAIEGPGHGHAALDEYARFLRAVGSPALPNDMVLWIVRAIVVLALVVHVTAVTQLWLRNRRAKPTAHRARRMSSTIAAHTMGWTGLLVLAFIVFHTLRFTTRTIHPTRLINHAVYYNAYGAFQKWWLVVIYVGAVALLAFHLLHGLWSAAQTTGIDNPDRNWLLRRLATALSVLVVVGFAAIPILYWADALPRPAATHVTTAH